MPKPVGSRRALAWTLAVTGSAIVVAWSIAGRVESDGVRVQAAPSEVASRGQGEAAKPFTVVARRFDFSPNRIEVNDGDVVKITLAASDIPHSFTIDAYRISKRATPGHPVAFEFRADQTGEFSFYCDLAIDDGCRRMKGTLVVTPRAR